MPLQTARCIVMRDPTVMYLESSPDDDDENDLSSKPPQRSAQHSCHVVFKALRDNVDPYDYECDSETDDDDDDDYSNTSVEEEATSCSSSSESSNDDDDEGDVATTTNAHRTVRFGTPLVTATFTRPVTTTEKKPELYYTEREYREFRRQFGRGRRSCCLQPHGTTLTTTATVVQFHVNVVTEIHETCHMLDNPSELYYSRTELQGFLDEFVASLAQGM